MASNPAAPAEAARPPARTGKPRELEDRLNRHVFHPLARRLALLLLPTLVSPNAVSVASALFVVGAAAFYTFGAGGWVVAAGFGLHLLWHVADGADGDLARLRGTASPAGELVDGVCDYAGHLVLYLGLFWLLMPSLGWIAFPLVLLSGLSRAAQSNHIESRRRIYLWRVYGVPWLQQAAARGDALFERRDLFSRIFAPMARFYVKLAAAGGPHDRAIDAAFAAAADRPAELRRLRLLTRRTSRPALVYQHLLGANPRTLILGASMAAGSPLWFILVETILLNMLIILSIRQNRRASRRLAARIAA